MWKIDLTGRDYFSSWADLIHRGQNRRIDELNMLDNQILEINQTAHTDILNMCLKDVENTINAQRFNRIQSVSM